MIASVSGSFSRNLFRGPVRTGSRSGHAASESACAPHPCPHRGRKRRSPALRWKSRDGRSGCTSRITISALRPAVALPGFAQISRGSGPGRRRSPRRRCGRKDAPPKGAPAPRRFACAVRFGSVSMAMSSELRTMCISGSASSSTMWRSNSVSSPAERAPLSCPLPDRSRTSRAIFRTTG